MHVLEANVISYRIHGIDLDQIYREYPIRVATTKLICLESATADLRTSNRMNGPSKRNKKHKLRAASLAGLVPQSSISDSDCKGCVSPVGPAYSINHRSRGAEVEHLPLIHFVRWRTCSGPMNQHAGQRGQQGNKACWDQLRNAQSPSPPTLNNASRRRQPMLPPKADSVHRCKRRLQQYAVRICFGEASATFGHFRNSVDCNRTACDISALHEPANVKRFRHAPGIATR